MTCDHRRFSLFTVRASICLVGAAVTNIALRQIWPDVLAFDIVSVLILILGALLACVSTGQLLGTIAMQRGEERARQAWDDTLRRTFQAEPRKVQEQIAARMPGFRRYLSSNPWAPGQGKPRHESD